MIITSEIITLLREAEAIVSNCDQDGHGEWLSKVRAVLKRFAHLPLQNVTPEDRASMVDATIANERNLDRVMHNVATRLDSMGYTVLYEYPGYLVVKRSHGGRWTVGTDNDTWMGQFLTEDDAVVGEGCFDTGLTRVSTDVEEIAQKIDIELGRVSDVVTAELAKLKDTCPHGETKGNCGCGYPYGKSITYGGSGGGAVMMVDDAKVDPAFDGGAEQHIREVIKLLGDNSAIDPLTPDDAAEQKKILYAANIALNCIVEAKRLAKIGGAVLPSKREELLHLL